MIGSGRRVAPQAYPLPACRNAALCASVVIGRVQLSSATKRQFAVLHWHAPCEATCECWCRLVGVPRVDAQTGCHERVMPTNKPAARPIICFACPTLLLPNLLRTIYYILFALGHWGLAFDKTIYSSQNHKHSKTFRCVPKYFLFHKLLSAVALLCTTLLSEGNCGL